MSTRSPVGSALIASIVFILVGYSVWAALPAKMSDVVSIADLEAEIAAKTIELESTLADKDKYQELTGTRRSASLQLALLAEAVAQHDGESKLKASAKSIRDTAMSLASASSFDDANQKLAQLKNPTANNVSVASPTPEEEWAKLVRNRALMDLLREKSDQVRKSLRRIKDPEAESRNASTMAVIGVAIGAQAHSRKTAQEQMLWSDWSHNFQKQMTRTARAIRERDSAAVLEHFTAAQAACDLCHEQFKK